LADLSFFAVFVFGTEPAYGSRGTVPYGGAPSWQ
jgi:hypothetical protein